MSAATATLSMRPTGSRGGAGGHSRVGLSVVAMARGRGRRGGGGRGRGRGRRGSRVAMDRGPLRNEDIDLDEVRVIDEDKEIVGVMSSQEALEIAEEAGLDLVLMSPEAKPPLCKIMNYSKFKYEQEKKQREVRKRAAATRIEVKELKMRYNIDTHDYGVRLRAATKFLDGGDRVKVICQFRGRENDFRQLGLDMFMRFCDDVGEGTGTLDGNPTMEGTRMVMMISPTKEKVANQVSKKQERQTRSKAQRGEGEASGDGDEEGEFSEDEGDYSGDEGEGDEEGTYDDEGESDEEEEEEMVEEEIVLTKK
jgi:translation initiation factor IF-3